MATSLTPASVVSATQDSLSCNLCMEHYDTTEHLPKILPCLHTFCNECLLDHVGSSAAFRCPVCREDITVPEGGASKIPINLAVRDIVEELHARVVVECAEHEGRECILVCVDCVDGLCVECVKGLVSGAHKEHRIEEFDAAGAVLRQKFGAANEDMMRALTAQFHELRERINIEALKRVKQVEETAVKACSVVNDWKQAQLKTLKHEVDQKLSKVQDAMIKEQRSVNKEDLPIQEIVIKLQWLTAKTECFQVDTMYSADNELIRMEELMSTITPTQHSEDQAQAQAPAQAPSLDWQEEDVNTDLVKEKAKARDASTKTSMTRVLSMPDTLSSVQSSVSSSVAPISEDTDEPPTCNDTRDDDDDERLNSLASETSVTSLKKAPSLPNIQTAVKDEEGKILAEDYEANLHVKYRNKSFNRVVYDNSGGTERLIGKTDDFLLIYFMGKKKYELWGMWEEHKACVSAKLKLEWLDNVSNSKVFASHVNKGEKALKEAIQKARKGNLKLNWPKK